MSNYIGPQLDLQEIQRNQAGPTGQDDDWSGMVKFKKCCREWGFRDGLRDEKSVQ